MGQMVKYEMTCPANSYYNQVSRLCAPGTCQTTTPTTTSPTTVLTTIIVTTIDTTTAEVATTPATTLTSSTTTAGPEMPSCTAPGFYPYPGDCTRYIKCVAFTCDSTRYNTRSNHNPGTCQVTLPSTTLLPATTTIATVPTTPSTTSVPPTTAAPFQCGTTEGWAGRRNKCPGWNGRALSQTLLTTSHPESVTTPILGQGAGLRYE
ncbi:hypothetical protein Fcan01_22837 [Folsomia candida]|uniref:Chitin-binding type-2 domain-containing protein n=1 Tax=Folsomia candida TaxID=158441 RepID=A0A226DBF1_FOLCA|nr:hypothetical protein Fcan01_22837 [Folsomia candida]